MHGRLLTVLTVAVLAAFLPASATAAETSWTPVAPAPPVPEDFTSGRLVDVAAVSPADVWAVGTGWNDADGLDESLITHWTGADWHAAQAPSMPDFQYWFSAVDAVSARDVWAVGYGYSPPDFIFRPVITHYDGSTWSMVPAPRPSTPGNANLLTDVDMISATDGWAVGWRSGTFGPEPLVMRWRNGRWTTVSVPSVGDSAAMFRHVYARAANDVWAVGSLGEPGMGQAPPGGPALIMHFDGTRWSRIEIPHGGDADATNDLWAVTAVSAGEVWAVGDSCVWGWNDTVCQPLILRLSRGVWQVVPSAGDLGTNLRDVIALSANDVWVVGYDLPSGAQEANHVEHWDGQRFTTVPANGGSISVQGQLASALEAATRLPGTGELWAAGWQDASPQVIRHG